MPLNHTASQSEKDKVAIKADNIYQAITTKTVTEVETYFDSNLSALSGMDNTQIDSWIDANVTDLASAKEAIKTLAKDSAFTSKHVKALAKALVVLAQKI
jgi:hypothetical protein